MSLTPDDFREIMRKNKEAMDNWHKRYGNPTLQKDEPENFHGDCDHPNTMEDSTATLLYIIVMTGGTIFKARWLIWIVTTIIYFKFITRHKK